MARVQVRDRRAKPQIWEASHGVAPDCLWSHSGLLVAWPLWTQLRVWDPRFPRGEGEGNGPQLLVGGPRGVMVRSTTASAQLAGVGRLLPTGPCSVVIQYGKTDATPRTVGAFGSASTIGNERFGAHIPAADSKVYWMYGGTTEGTTQLSVSGLTFGYDTWVFTVGLRGMEIWQNGTLVASNAANPTRVQGTSVEGPFKVASVGSDNADAGVYLVYERQLSEWEVRRLSLDPWTPFRPARSVHGLPAAGATATLRATQAGVEALTVGTSTLRVTHAGVEALVQETPATATLRATQGGIEALTLPTPALRSTQAGVEALTSPTAATRATQTGVEALVLPTPALWVTQAGIETLVKPSALSLTYKGQLWPRGAGSPLTPA